MARPRKPVEASTGKISVLKLDEKRKSEAAIRYNRSLLDVKPESMLIDEVASETWDIVVPEILKMPLAGNVDLFNVIGLCNSWAAYIDVTKKLQKKWEVRRKGIPRENPLVAVQKKYADEVRKFERLCAIDLDGRLKAGEKKVKQQDKELKKKFGEI